MCGQVDLITTPKLAFLGMNSEYHRSELVYKTSCVAVPELQSSEMDHPKADTFPSDVHAQRPTEGKVAAMLTYLFLSIDVLPGDLRC